jgi:hypothetical protein
MRYPNIYLVGAPKCGTTSLHFYLAQHPNIFAPDFKEPHYHTVSKTGWPTWGVKDLQQYFDLYKSARSDQMCLDASAWNLYVPESAKFIYDTCPNAYIIISLRHPVRRAYSHFMHMVQRQWEKYYVFEDAITHEAQRIENGEFWDVHYLSVGYYANQVKRYLEVFPKCQIKVLIFEEWIQNPELAVRDILNFLKIDSNISLFDVKESKNITQISYAQLLRIYLKKIKGLEKVISLFIPKLLKNEVIKWLQMKNSKSIPILNHKLEIILMNHYLKDIEELENLLDRKIDSWHKSSLD